MAMGEKRIIPWSVNGVEADGAGDIALGTGQVTGLDAALQAKADKTAVDAALQTKADKTAVDAALSHKANVNNGHYSGNIDGLSSSGVWVCVNAGGTLPPGFPNWFTLAAFPGGTGSVIQIASLNVGQNMPNRTCIRHHNGTGWDAWGSLATAADLAEKVSKGGDTMTGILAFSDIMGSDRHAEIIQWNGETHIRNTVGGSSYQDIVIKPDGLYYSGFADGVSFNYQIAPPTPPQVYALPLAAGFSEYLPCRYWRTRDGEVNAVIRVAFSAVTDGQICAILPAGYRPGMVVSVTFAANLNSSARVFGIADLAPDGSVRLYPHAPITSPGNAILNPFVFVAGH